MSNFANKNWLYAVILLLILQLPCLAAEITEHIQAARSYMQAKQWDYASYEWRNILEQSPQNIEAQIGLAESLINSGLASEAIQQLEKAVKDVQSIELFLTLAKAYKNTQNYASAYDIYQEILSLNAYHPKAFKELKELLPKLSQEYRNRSSEILADTANEARRKANEALLNENFNQAAKYLEIVSLYTPKASTINDYGLALLLNGESQAAKNQFKRLDKIVKRSWRVNANLALLALSYGNMPKATEFMELALRLCDDSAQKAKLYNNLGYIYELSQRPSRARFAYEHALELDPGLTKAKMNLAYILIQTQNYKEAENTYKEIIRSQPNNAIAWNHM